MTSPSKAVVGWYEGPNSRCRHKIFGDIFFPASGISTVCLLEDFLADDAKQAFVIWIEDRGTRVSGCGHISDQGRKLISPREWQYLRRHDVRLCGMPGIHNDAQPGAQLHVDAVHRMRKKIRFEGFQGSSRKSRSPPTQ